MRRSLDGLRESESTRFEEIPARGHLFVFVNRWRMMVKIAGNRKNPIAGTPWPDTGGNSRCARGETQGRL